MSFQPRSSSFQRVRPRPPAGSETRGSFAVGSQVLITATTPGQKELELIDVDGMPTGVHLPVDEPTVITAWRPRRAAPARYRVRSAAGIEGWIDAPNLRRRPAPPPPPPPPPVAAAPVEPPKAKSAPTMPKPRTAVKPGPSATRAKPSPSARPRVRPKEPKKSAKKASPRKPSKRAR